MPGVYEVWSGVEALTIIASNTAAALGSLTDKDMPTLFGADEWRKFKFNSADLSTNPTTFHPYHVTLYQAPPWGDKLTYVYA